MTDIEQRGHPEHSGPAAYTDERCDTPESLSENAGDYHVVVQSDATKPVQPVSRTVHLEGLTSRYDEQEAQHASYRVDAAAHWEQWFRDAFYALQQINCRTIAKEWIKAIHPKKQQECPYNGKRPNISEWKDEVATRPRYWPESVVHQEPDHLLKEGR